VADPAIELTPPDGESFPALPGARREIQAIRRAFPSGRVTLATGRQAAEEQVRELMPGKTVIHLATHAVVRDDRPMESFLALAGSSKDPGNDGRLTAREVYDLDLAADLVVLSACRSGSGRISGDGIIGLSRAFFYAGAPSVLGTLWDVADEPTFLLVSRFYSAFAGSQDKSRSLRQAQLSLIRALRQGQVQISTPAGAFKLPEHPLLWAGFVLQGQP
jgi:CHAT domain-containing protein